jgi:hypothetical protein
MKMADTIDHDMIADITADLVRDLLKQAGSEDEVDADEIGRRVREQLPGGNSGEKGFDSSKHPRGQPNNAGQFGPGGSGVKPTEKSPQPSAKARAAAESRKPKPKPEKEPEEEREDEEQPVWDHSVDNNYVSDRRSYERNVATWNFTDSGENYEQTISLEEADYDPFPERGDDGHDIENVYRWVSSQDGSPTDHGDWTAFEDDARREGQDFAERSNEDKIEPDADEDEEAPRPKRSKVSNEKLPDPHKKTASAQVEINETTLSVAHELLDGSNDSETRDNVASACGAPDGTNIQCSGATKLKVSVHGEGIQYMKRTVAKDKEGRVFIHNDLFVVDDETAPEGFGTSCLAREVEQASKLGVAYIETHAAGYWGNTEFNGYYTWPRLGYDQTLDVLAQDRGSGHTDGEQVAKKAREAFPDAESVLDIMSTAEGREWWKKNGCDLLHAKFDLTPGSRSMRVHKEYLEERAKR